MLNLREKKIFVAGADIRSGKTFVCIKILKMMLKNGQRPGYFKPLSTGGIFKNNMLACQDVLLVKSKTGIEDKNSVLCPVVYEIQSQPLVAAELSGMPLSMTKIRSSYRQFCEKHEAFVVEGVAGVLEPLNSEILAIELIKELKLPVLLVAASKPGFLNMITLSVRALRDFGIRIIGIILSATSDIDTGISVKPALSKIEKITGVPFIYEFQHEMDWK